MSERVIPLVDWRANPRAIRLPAGASVPTGQLHDTRGRPLRDLRISVTDRCNLPVGALAPAGKWMARGLARQSTRGITRSDMSSLCLRTLMPIHNARHRPQYIRH